MNDQVQPLIFRGKADWTFYLELTVSLAVTAWGIWSFVAHRNILMLLVGVACALVDAVGLAQLWRTRYVLEEEGMQLQSGISRLYVSYSSITDLDAVREAKVTGYVPLAMGRHRLYVIFAEGDKTYRLELSPDDREGFQEALRQRVEQGAL